MNRDQLSACLNFLLSSPSIPSPCFVLDVERLLLNLQVLNKVQEKTGVKILLALKCFAAWSVFPLLSRTGTGCLWGTCASSVDEARLGRENFGGEVHAFAAAWDEKEFSELLKLVDHISFNSIAQWQKFIPKIQRINATERHANPISAGLRINPEHSEGAIDLYNPCAPGSRLGIRQKDMPVPGDKSLSALEGLHFHALCEQDAQPLANILKAFEEKFAPHFSSLKWLNFGGGHHITRDGYNLDLLCSLLNDWRRKYGLQIYLEPGEAVALDAGWLYTTVLDIVYADMPIAILDSSAACHMPDVLEMPYTPDLWYKSGKSKLIQRAQKPGEDRYICRIAGKSCLAGDVIGEYSFSELPKIGDNLVFADMAIYSMVKTNTFNGLRLPAIAIYDSREQEAFKLIRDFSYEDFKSRLS